MADVPADHSRWTEALAAFTGAVSATGAVLYRRKKKNPSVLSDEEFERLQGIVIATLRKEMQATLESHEQQMQHALSLIEHGVLEIRRLVIDVPAIKGRISQLESAMEVAQGDITSIRGRQNRDRER